MDSPKFTNFIRKFFRRTPQNQAWRKIDVPQDTPSNGTQNQSLAAKARQKTQKLLNFFSILRQIWRIAKPYWRSQDRFRAYGLLAAALLLNFGIVTMAVKINQINSSLFDALQNYDAKGFLNNLLMFGGVAAVFIGFAVYRYYIQQILAIRWRKWLTEYYCDRYLSQQIYYHLQMSGRAADNPDQRLADDAHQFIGYFLKFTLGVTNSLLTLISFIVVLWRLSGSLTLDLSSIGLDVTLVIPGYLVILSLLYAGFGTWMILRLSQPLVALNYHMEKSEADLRFGLIRVRESAEQVALLRGEAQENRRLRDRLSQLIEITYAVAKRRKLMIVLTNGYSQISSIFPLMVIAPRFFAKSVSLGGMMQTVGAFNQVQDALSYLVDNYNEFAEFQAVTLRLSGFENALLRPTAPPLSENSQAESRAELQRHISTKAEIILQNLQIYTPQNQPILPPISLKIAPEEKIVITGRSGLGKSSVLRTVAGIWPYASGSITTPPVSELFFLPQKPYLPIGSLSACLTYPLPPESVDIKTLRAILEECGRADWCDKLDQEQNWATCLSQGEAQIIGFVRLLCAKPAVALLDEATSSLDIDKEASLYAMVLRSVPNLTLLSIAHRPSLFAFHDRKIDL